MCVCVCVCVCVLFNKPHAQVKFQRPERLRGQIIL